MQTQESTTAPRSRPMHKYVFMGIGIWVVFVLTFVIAYFRVGSNGNYDGVPFRSITDAEPQRPASTYK